MSQTNLGLLCGILKFDPKPLGETGARLVVSNRQQFKDKIYTHDIDVVVKAWGKLAHNILDHLHEGSHVLVTYELRTEKREVGDAVVYYPAPHATAIEFLDAKPDRRHRRPTVQDAPPDDPSPFGEDDDPVDEIPF